MIRINIICIGKIKEKYFTDAISEYAKRLTAFCKFAVVELAEEKIRNTAAHDIVSVTEITIKNRTGFSADKIMQMIQKLFIYTGIKIKKEYWDSYDQMNQAIIQKMELIEA